MPPRSRSSVPETARSWLSTPTLSAPAPMPCAFTFACRTMLCSRRFAMCELLGMECNVPTDIVFSFTGLRQRGGRTAEHADGWGLALYEGKSARIFLEPSAAASSPLARFVAENPIKTLLAVGHIR